MVINHLLSEKDKEAIQKAENKDGTNKIFDLTDIVSLGKTLDDYDKHFFECLAYLISEKRIEIKVVKPKNSNGVVHYKEGVFFDGKDYVGYSGSCNFTLFGLSENREKLNAFLSWENGRSNKFIKKQLQTIDDYFTEQDKEVDYLSADAIEVAIRDQFGKKNIEELIVQEGELLRRKQGLTSNPKVEKTIKEVVAKDPDIKERMDNVCTIPGVSNYNGCCRRFRNEWFCFVQRKRASRLIRGLRCS